jgi:tetratricopeptide (TPR) repeat protein
MSILRRNPRRFSTAESFRLFMEGIRGLQLHEDEAAKSEIVQNGAPLASSRENLEQTLAAAYENLNECVAQYPDDLLPHYYRGIVLGLKAQELQALQLVEYLSRPAELPGACKKADELLGQAVSDFGQVIASARGQMRLYAQYNSAQAMARLNEPANWRDAIEILSQIDLDHPDLSALPRWKRIMARLMIPFMDQERNVVYFAGRLFRQLGGEQGVLSSLARARAEQEALRLQVELLKSFLNWRYNSRTQLEADPKIDTKTKQELLRRAEVAVGWLSSFVQLIQKAGIPSDARDDMEADYWNKTAFLLWEQATREKDLPFVDMLLQQAETSVKRAMSLKGRKSWTPAQLNLARILLAQGKTDETKKALDAILGVDPSPIPAPVVPVEESTSVDTIVDLILKMAPANDGQAIAESIQAAWGKLDREAIQTILARLAGQLAPSMLRQVITNI